MSIQIDRNEYTNRDRLLPGRSIYLIKLNAIVPNDSYLITASMPTQLPDISNKITSIINDIKGKNWNDSGELYNFIRSSIRRLEDTREKVKNLFPKINNKYFIPGSTLKGAIRSRIEYKLAPKDNKSLSCYIVEDNFYQGAINHIKFWGNDVRIFRPTCNINYNNRVCRVCDIFGSPSLSSLVSFSDAYLVNESVEKLNDLGYEAAKPGSRFNLKITSFNFNKIMLGLLFLGLELYSKSPIILGMLKYRYNKKVGNLYKNKYSIGLLRFELKEIKDHKGNVFDANKIIDECKRELEGSNELNQYIEWNRGVIC